MRDKLNFYNLLKRRLFIEVSIFFCAFWIPSIALGDKLHRFQINTFRMINRELSFQKVEFYGNI
jgi:hypothetical protein